MRKALTAAIRRRQPSVRVRAGYLCGSRPAGRFLKILSSFPGVNANLGERFMHPRENPKNIWL